MTLERAVRMVARDTRENTDPTFTDREAIECVRKEITIDDLSVIDDLSLLVAYQHVLNASQRELDAVLG